MRVVILDADATILARSALAVIDLDLARATKPPSLTYALVIIDLLDTLGSARQGARVGQAFVDVTLAPLANVTRWAVALIASNPVNTFSSMVAST